MSRTKAKTNSIDIYKVYIQQYGKKMPLNVFSSIIKDINEGIMDKIVNGFEFKMPYNLGSIYVKKRKLEFLFDELGKFKDKYTKAGVNWKATKDLWAVDENAKNNKLLIWYDNPHTDGYKYRFFWDKSKGISIKNLSYYKFAANRATGKRHLAAVLKKGTNTLYYI